MTRYTGFTLVNGGLISSFFQYLLKGKKDKKNIVAISLVCVTWFMLGVLSLISGTLFKNVDGISFLEDFTIHVRFLLVIPFLIYIEGFVEKTFVNYIKYTDSIIPDSQQERFNTLLHQLTKLSNSRLPEICILALFYILSFLRWEDLSIFESGKSYLSIEEKLNVAGWYYWLFCSPLFMIILFRWVWRWIIWIYSIIRISYLNIQTDPLHADQMAGLEYLNIVPLSISYILIAPSAVLSAKIGVDIIYSNAIITDYIFTIAAYVFLLPIILYAPLLLFMPKCLQARIDGVQSFGKTIRKHNQAYKNTWIEGKGKDGQQLLGTMDNSSLADINGSYTPLQNLKLVPINLKMVLISFVMNLIPYIPLIFTYYSISEIFSNFIKSML